MGKIRFLVQFVIVQSNFCLIKAHSNFDFKNFTKIFMSNFGGSCSLIKDFKDFQFSPSKLIELPIEENRDNYVRRNIKGAIFSWVDPTPILNPKLVHFSEDVLTEILNVDRSVTKNQEFVNFVAGNNVLKSSTPLAHRYGGHQFGYWAMQLGDGRAILLGEFENRFVFLLTYIILCQLTKMIHFPLFFSLMINHYQ